MVIILGAGIAGLTLANALQKSRQDYVVLERAEKLEPVGAGIILQNNGLAILEKLALRDCIQGSSPKTIALGLGSNPTQTDLLGTGLKALCVTRAELQRVLLLNIPKEKIHLSVDIAGVAQGSHSVVITERQGEIHRGRICVNAAGINSSFHTKPTLRKTDQHCWRALVETTKPLTIFGEYWYGHQRFGIGAVSDRQAYVFHVARITDDLNADTYHTTDREAWLMSLVSDLPFLENVNFGQAEWLSHPLADREINWGNNRIVAIGDAAHAVTPNLGQGAVIAMEDAIVLARLLKNEQPNLVRSLIAARHRRVKTVQSRSWSAGQFAHSQHWLVRGIKNLIPYLPSKLAVRLQVAWMNKFIKAYI
jgi:2-heptyl-3-hydroxy-4(1H)-quinolone synthase